MKVTNGDIILDSKSPLDIEVFVHWLSGTNQRLKGADLASYINTMHPLYQNEYNKADKNAKKNSDAMLIKQLYNFFSNQRRKEPATTSVTTLRSATTPFKTPFKAPAATPRKRQKTDVDSSSKSEMKLTQSIKKIVTDQHAISRVFIAGILFMVVTILRQSIAKIEHQMSVLKTLPKRKQKFDFSVNKWISRCK